MNMYAAGGRQAGRSTTPVVDDTYLTNVLPSLYDGDIIKRYQEGSANGGDRRCLCAVPLISQTGGKLTHNDVLRIIDMKVPKRGEGGGRRLLLIFIRPPDSQMGHFILCAEKVNAESHYVWWDSLNLSNTVLEEHFGVPATEMFSGGSLFERGFSQWQSNSVMAEARWATCGYWCVVWAHMLNTSGLEGEEKDLRQRLSQPIVRDGGAFTEKTLHNPQADQGANSWKMLQTLIELNACMLQYYSAI
jgi:hypothetical protein